MCKVIPEPSKGAQGLSMTFMAPSGSSIRVTSCGEVLQTGLLCRTSVFLQNGIPLRDTLSGIAPVADVALASSAAGPAPEGPAGTSPLAEDGMSDPIYGGGHTHPDFCFLRRETYPRTGAHPRLWGGLFPDEPGAQGWRKRVLAEPRPSTLRRAKSSRVMAGYVGTSKPGAGRATPRAGRPPGARADTTGPRTPSHLPTYGSSHPASGCSLSSGTWGVQMASRRVLCS